MFIDLCRFVLFLIVMFVALSSIVAVFGFFLIGLIALPVVAVAILI